MSHSKNCKDKTCTGCGPKCEEAKLKSRIAELEDLLGRARDQMTRAEIDTKYNLFPEIIGEIEKAL